jgi:crossover junction endodeoxyribonuclease RuvC
VMRVLGIDPGTGRLGYAVAEETQGTYSCLTVGCFTTTPGLGAGERLATLREHLEALIEEHPPAGAVLERLYFSKNVRTALPVAEARGMILTLLADARVPVVELSPQHVKLGVTGYGRATKDQVQRMVQRLFTLASPPRPDDAADALALAFAGLSHFRRR